MECCANWFVCCQLPTNMIWPNWFQWSAIIPWHLWAIYKIDFVKEHILLLLFSQHQGLNRSIRLPRCNALWPQHEQSWDVSFTLKCPYIPIHNKSSQESAGTHPKHVFSKIWNTCHVITLGRACCMRVSEWSSKFLFVAQAPSYCQHQFGRRQSCLGETAGRTVQHEHCP